MNKLAIYHKSKSYYAYAVSENKLHIRLRTAFADFDKVILVYGDKYSWHHKKELRMECVLSDVEYDYYQIEIFERSKRFTYYFKLIRRGEVHFFTEAGIVGNILESKFSEYFFQYPYINETDLHVVPEWIHSVVCYQIFPERFCNGNPDLNPPGTVEWGTEPTTDNFMGGDLPGIISKLEYLKELGINVIYMTPFFKSNSSHKYDIIDYFEIDPHFGTKEDFKELVDKAHGFGMKVFLDAVFNHSATDFFAFRDVVENEEKSKYKDWFFIKKFPIDMKKISYAEQNATSEDWYILDGEEVLSYECFGYYSIMPKLDTNNPELQDYLINVGKYWIKEFNVDGWRLDVSNEISHTFWRKFRQQVKALNKDALIIGEIWDNGEPWLRGDQFDGAMNYGLTQAVKDHFARNIIDKETFRVRINKLLMRNTDTANSAMLNLLDSHDTERMLTSLKENEDKMIMCLGIVYTFIGIPMIYYGTEIGMTGENDPGCRKCMIWDSNKWNKKIFETVKKLIKIRTDEKALHYGNFKWVDIHEELITYTRSYENESILVIINNTAEPIKYDLLSDYENTVELIGNKQYNSIEKYGLKILKFFDKVDGLYCNGTYVVGIGRFE